MLRYNNLAKTEKLVFTEDTALEVLASQDPVRVGDKWWVCGFPPLEGKDPVTGMFILNMIEVEIIGE